MRLTARLLLGACLLLSVLAAHARAGDFSLPGLEGDADQYAHTLATPNPAGGTPAARHAAEARAQDAERHQNWDAAAAAWAQRVGLGDAGAAAWMSLAQAQMRRTPPDANHALLAAWQAYGLTQDGRDQVPPLLMMADALRLLDRPEQEIAALQAALDLSPDDAHLRNLLADARRATGVLVRNLTTEDEADPPRACITFTVPPVRRDDFHPEDWVRLDPPVPGAAITREGDQICASGLPSGQTTRLILRQGLPGEDGLTLMHAVTLAAAIGNRAPRVVFDQRLFILPRGQAPAVGMTTVNLSSVKLTLARMTERNIITFLRRNKLGETVESYAAGDIGTEYGRIVWTGTAAVPAWTPNRNAHTTLPLPDALRAAGPGVYALTVAAGDGTPDAGDAQAVQMIVNTDLAPTVWRGDDGLTVQVRSYADVRPRAGVKLQLLSEGNDILAETTTDADGVARFAAPLLHGAAAAAPRAINAFAGDDFATLDLQAAAFDLSDRGVAGQAYPGPLDAYVYTDRGIYRPGETVQVMALLRDAAGKPSDFPARVTVKRPNGQVFLQATPPRAAEASVHLPVALSAGAAAGTWTIEVQSDPDAAPIGTATFRVDAFVPDRMAVEVGPAPGPIVPGQPYALPVIARFLYGAPAAGLSGKAHVQLAWDPSPFPALDGYRVGLQSETYAPDAQEIELPDTDANGRTTLDLPVAAAPDSTHPLHASVTAEINDPSGHAARGRLDVKLRPAGPLIGIKPAFTDDAVDANAEAGFDIIAVDPDGARAALPARLRVVREEPTWHLVMQGQVARYQMAWKDAPLETRDVTIPATGTLHIAQRLGFGRYRIELTQAGGLAATSYRFRSGWVATDDPDVPDQLDVSVDSRAHRPGETARVHIAAPYDGQAALLVIAGRVHLLRNVSIAAGGTDVDVPVAADWGPGAYAVVHAYRPAGQTAKDATPERAIGLAWIGIDPAVRTIAAKIEAPDKLPPRARAVVPVHTEPGAWVTLAAVDEGILRLTSFASPDPAPHFLGRRTLGLDIRDDWGRLIGPASGQATVLKQGGDAGFALPDVPIRTVTLFTPPMQADADGIARVPLDLPDFAGQVRLMAVTWHDDHIGSVSADVLVRDPLVAEPLLPRFLAPGDDARFTVLVHNLELPAGPVRIQVSTDGPLQVSGPATLAATLAAGAQATPVTTLHATGVGRAVVKLDVSGPGGFAVHRETALTVRPSRAPLTIASAAEIPPGVTAPIDAAFDRFIPGTAHAAALFGGAVRYDVPGLVRALDEYPLMCLEQASSKGFPLVFLQDGALAGNDRAVRVQASIARVLDLQRYDGGFGLWSAAGDAKPWLSAYATEFLYRARQARLPVPEAALKDALKYLGNELDGTPDKPEDYAAAAYALYVVALAGDGRPGLARVMAQAPEKLPTPLSRAQVAAALALGHDRARAEALFRDALAFHGRKFWYEDDGSALRDQAALVVLLRESGLLPDELRTLIAQLPGADLDTRWLSTQEQSWTIAAAAVLGRDGGLAQVSVDGRMLPPAPLLSLPLRGPVRVVNGGDRPLWQTVSITGTPVQAPPAARNLMKVSRHFFTLDGKPLDLDHLRQNTVFILEIDGSADDADDHQAMLLAGLPAGWEIARRLPAGAQPGMPWLGELSETQAEPAADDRFAAVLDLSGGNPGFRVAVELRAVTPGSFEYPGTALSDMYRPAIYARQAATRVTVLPLE